MWGDIIRYAEVTSTNDLARDHARRGAGEGTVVVADWQTEGRGRLGREWLAPAGTALLASFILRPPAALAHSAWLTLGAGVAAAQAVRRTSPLEARLKWPNDIRVGGLKVGGVLTEVGRADEGVVAIVGIGLNVSQTADDFPLELASSATSLALAGAKVDRDALLLALSDELRQVWELVRAGALASLRERWLALDETIGRDVVVVGPDGQWSGHVTGLDDQGALWVDDAVGEAKRVVAGDVSLRLDG